MTEKINEAWRGDPIRLQQARVRDGETRLRLWRDEMARAQQSVAVRPGSETRQAIMEVPAFAGSRQNRAGTTRLSAPSPDDIAEAEHAAGPAASDHDEAPTGRGAGLVQRDGDTSREQGADDRAAVTAPAEHAGDQPAPPRHGMAVLAMVGQGAGIGAAAAQASSAGAGPVVAQNGVNASQPVRSAAAPAPAAAPAGGTGNATVRSHAQGQREPVGMTGVAIALQPVGNSATVGRPVPGALPVMAATASAAVIMASAADATAPLAEESHSAGMAPADFDAHAAMARGEAYRNRHLYIHLGEDGVHAYLRDAQLAPQDLLAIAEALYAQGDLPGQQHLARLFVNGQAVARPVRRGLHDAEQEGRAGASDDPSLFEPMFKETIRHDHQRR